MNAPKVSILIPVFNREEYIAECIQSALDQCFIDFEIIVVDNASDDRTWEICKEFAASDQRIRIFRNETNVGPVRNWIRCVQLARGEFSKILFSDDCLEPNCLSEMVPKLDDAEVALVYCAARIGKSKDESIIDYCQVDSSRLHSKKFINCVVSGAAPVSPGAILIRTHDLLHNLHTTFPTSTLRSFEKNGAGPDVMIMLLTSKSYPFVEHIACPLVFFRAHTGSFTINNKDDKVNSGYRSAISYFLKINNTKFEWIGYVARNWLFEMRKNKKYTSPTKYLKMYEGVGRFNELSIFLWCILGILFDYVRRK